MKNSLVYLSLALLFSQSALAANGLNQQDDLKSINTLPNIEDIKGTIPAYEMDLRTQQRKQYTEKELLEDKNKLEELFYQALLAQDIANVTRLKELYIGLDEIDQSLLDWADAIIAVKTDLNHAITLYRKLIAQLPNVSPIRFQLATILFFNTEYDAAKNQFEKLRAEEGLSVGELKMLDDFLSAIAAKDKWSFNFGLNYLQDNNINNSPPQGTKFNTADGGELVTSSKPEKASGFAMQIGADKQWSLTGGKYVNLGVSSNLDYYFDNKKYNELSMRLTSGLGYENPRFSHSVNPYVSKRFTANNRAESLRSYSETVGVNYNIAYWLNPKLKYSIFWDMSYDHYRKRNQDNQGMTNMISTSLFYLLSPKQYWMLSYDVISKNARSQNESYLRNGVRLSWGQEWPLGISTSTTIGAAKRNYEGGFFVLGRRKSNEYTGRLSVWHRAVHLGGVTPRLTWTYNKVKNNIKIYDYEKSKLFLEFSKIF